MCERVKPVGVELVHCFDRLACGVTTGMLDSEMQPAEKGRRTNLSNLSFMLGIVIRLNGELKLLGYI